MNKSILKELGFEKELERVEQGRCPFCNKMVLLDEFKDDLSRKEFEISGLCQTCQDDTFG